MILVIDNYDSFVHNLARYLILLGHTTRVVRNDVIVWDQVEQSLPDAIVISPGPCTPAEAGSSLEVIRRFGDRVPILGVCLGHQAIAAAWGARIVRAARPVHGRASRVTHDGSELFAGIPNPFLAGRYHSLVVDPATLPRCLEVTAWTTEDQPRMVMGIRHRHLRVWGVQFHPESILTEHGFRILKNFLQLAGLRVTPNEDRYAAERIQPAAPEVSWSGTPITF